LTALDGIRAARLQERERAQVDWRLDLTFDEQKIIVSA